MFSNLQLLIINDLIFAVRGSHEVFIFAYWQKHCQREYTLATPLRYYSDKPRTHAFNWFVREWNDLLFRICQIKSDQCNYAEKSGKHRKNRNLSFKIGYWKLRATLDKSNTLENMLFPEHVNLVTNFEVQQIIALNNGTMEVWQTAHPITAGNGKIINQSINRVYCHELHRTIYWEPFGPKAFWLVWAHFNNNILGRQHS